MREGAKPSSEYLKHRVLWKVLKFNIREHLMDFKNGYIIKCI